MPTVHKTFAFVKLYCAPVRRDAIVNVMATQPEFDDDCLKWWGRVLRGAYAHWCAEWDDLPIDEHCNEFFCCSCYQDETFLKLRRDAADRVDALRSSDAVEP